jgi:glycosyltransferase involved in cell wall biosynthesis
MTKGLNIGFDGKRAVMNYTGIGNYSRLALQCLASLLPEGSNLRIYTPRLKPNPRLEPLLSQPGVKLCVPDTWTGRMMAHLWRSRGLTSQLQRDCVDLYHGLSNELPMGIERSGIPSVVTIHDLIFLRHPEFYHRPDVAICNRKFAYAARAATRVIAISERTSLDLQEFYGISPEKIDIVYQGCADIFHQPVTVDAIAAVRRKYSLPDSYIVGVGTIEVRKNQLLAVRALPALPADVELVLVGRQTAYAKQIAREAQRLGVAARVHMLENVPMTDIAALYAGAIMASYPSHYEGFGIPMLEAIAAGVPVVAATGSCLEEAGGPGGVYVNPLDVEQFAAEANRLLNDSTLRRSMVAEGRKYIARVDADNFGRGLISVYSNVLQKPITPTAL